MEPDLNILRTRARRLRLTIKSSRGTAYGYYHLQAGSSAEFVSIICDGLSQLEGWIRDLETDVATDPRPVSFTRLRQAEQTIKERRHAEYVAYCEATHSKICAYCAEAQDGEDAYAVGPEDARGFVPQWVHRRCYDAYCAQTQRALEARGFSHGVRA